MLCVTRKAEEWITVVVPPSDRPRVVQIELVSATEDKASIGVVAERDIVVHRNEVCRKIIKSERSDDKGILAPAERKLIASAVATEQQKPRAAVQN